MLFNSYAFVFLFAPIVYGIYWSLKSRGARKWCCFLASYVFYGVWSWKFALLMLATTSVDYFTAQRLEDSEDAFGRRAWLILSMCSNLGVLATFKYFDFAAVNVNTLFHHAVLPLLNVALPIGISFYTFESMSYTIDVYRRKTRALRRFIDYGHFVTMFPRLVAGPIARYADVAEQLAELPERLEPESVLEGVQFFIIGLAKKVLIADFLASHVVDVAMEAPARLHLTSAWTASFAYTAQLYFDFSGYSDMAVGLALLLGFRLPRNFELPYASANPSEFWRRWHISLSTWLRDYLYIPLGGNRAHLVRNLMITMLLGGLWHGANWTFVIWGAYHGIALCLYNARILRADGLPRAAAVGANFVFVVIGWGMFRSTSVSAAWSLYRAMLGLNGVDLAWTRAHASVIAVTALALTVSFTVDTYDLRPMRRPVLALVLGVLAVACAARFGLASPFLYFQF